MRGEEPRRLRERDFGDTGSLPTPLTGALEALVDRTVDESLSADSLDLRRFRSGEAPFRGARAKFFSQANSLVPSAVYIRERTIEYRSVAAQEILAEKFWIARKSYEIDISFASDGFVERVIAAGLDAFAMPIIPSCTDAKLSAVNQLYTLDLMGTLIFSPLCSNRFAVLAIRAGTVTTSPLTHG